MHSRFLLFAALPLCASAQDQDIQRALIQRDQQSDAFTLQLRQSQERLALPPGDFQRQQQFDARQIFERQRLDQVNEQQLRDVRPEAPAHLQSYERQKAADERRLHGTSY
jgi:hypothetical protein